MKRETKKRNFFPFVASSQLQNPPLISNKKRNKQTQDALRKGFKQHILFAPGIMIAAFRIKFRRDLLFLLHIFYFAIVLSLYWIDVLCSRADNKLVTIIYVYLRMKRIVDFYSASFVQCVRFVWLSRIIRNASMIQYIHNTINKSQRTFLPRSINSVTIWDVSVCVCVEQSEFCEWKLNWISKFSA